MRSRCSDRHGADMLFDILDRATTDERASASEPFAKPRQPLRNILKRCDRIGSRSKFDQSAVEIEKQRDRPAIQQGIKRWWRTQTDAGSHGCDA